MEIDMSSMTNPFQIGSLCVDQCPYRSRTQHMRKISSHMAELCTISKDIKCVHLTGRFQTSNHNHSAKYKETYLQKTHTHTVFLENLSFKFKGNDRIIELTLAKYHSFMVNGHHQRY